MGAHRGWRRLGRQVIAAIGASAVFASTAIAQIFSTPLATGDVNGDGYDDVVAAAAGLAREGGLGEVHVIDGRRGTELWRAVGRNGELCAGLGVAVITAGVEHPLVVVVGRIVSSRELVLDVHHGSNGRLERRFVLPPGSSEEWCCALAPLAARGEGHTDVLLAVGRGSFSGAAECCGRLSLLSLSDGSELAVIEGTGRYQLLGASLACGRFDERPGLDVVATEQDGYGRSLRWLSSPNLEWIGVTPAPRDGSSFGPSLATFGDWNADELDEIVVGTCTPPEYDDGTNGGEARVYGVTSVDPLHAFAVERIEDNKGPFVVALPNGPDSMPLIGLATPWENWSAGIVRIFDSAGVACLRRVEWSEVSDNYYGVGLAVARVPGRARPDLVTVGQTRKSGAGLSGVAIECLGGDGGLDRRWRYEFDARPAVGPAIAAAAEVASREEPCRFATRAFEAKSQANGALPPRPLVSLATGDVDGDGYDDVALAYAHAGGRHSGGALHVIDGKHGSRRWAVSGFAERAETLLGVTVVAASLDTPLVVTAVRENASRALRLELLDASSGTRRSSIRLPPCDEEWSCALSPLDDVDGDGVCELAVGRPWFDDVEPRAGRVSIVSLVEGCELASLDGNEADEGLGRVLAIGRFDRRDGLDVATTSHRAHSTLVRWLSSPELATVAEASKSMFDVEFATSLATLGDCDSDGLDELAVTARRSAEADLNDTCTDVFVLSPDSPEGASQFSPDSERVDWAHTAILCGVAPGERHLAVGEPGRSVIRGAWYVLDERFAVERQVLDRRRTTYPLALAAADIRRDPPSRLIVVGAALVRGLDHAVVDVECWGGPAWTTCLWSYELEAEAR